MLKKTVDEVKKMTTSIPQGAMPLMDLYEKEYREAKMSEKLKPVDSDKKSKVHQKESSKNEEKKTRLESMLEEKSGPLSSSKSYHDPSKEKEKIQSTLSRLSKGDNKNEGAMDEDTDFFTWQPSSRYFLFEIVNQLGIKVEREISLQIQDHRKR
jgi:hypothetical protein